MKKLQILLLTFFATAALSSCKLGIFEDEVSPRGEVEKVFDLDDFDEISYGNAYEVEIVPSRAFKVTAMGDERDVDDLDIRVRNGKLDIDYLKNGWFSGSKRYRMHLLIEVPSIKSLDLSGASSTEVLEFAGLEDLFIELSGASKLRFKSKIDELVMDISGASTANIYDPSNLIDAQVSGASTLNAVENDTFEAILDVSGASRVNIAVTDKLEVEASGASTVKYRGSPTVKKKTSGASKVVQD